MTESVGLRIAFCSFGKRKEKNTTETHPFVGFSGKESSHNRSEVFYRPTNPKNSFSHSKFRMKGTNHAPSVRRDAREGGFTHPELHRAQPGPDPTPKQTEVGMRGAQPHGRVRIPMGFARRGRGPFPHCPVGSAPPEITAGASETARSSGTAVGRNSEGQNDVK